MPEKFPPSTWPVGARPTGDQLVTWIRSFGPEHDLRIAGHLLDGTIRDADRGARCFEANHDAYPDEIYHLKRRILELLQSGHRYRSAWLSARRRARKS